MSQVLLIAKKDDWSKKAMQVATDAFGRISCISAGPTERIPEDISWHDGDLLISFLCPWVLPKSLLKRFKVAINFHPASSDYPGIGCYNFAIYDGVETYGAVCHHMISQADAGSIIEEQLFPVFPNDTVSSLKHRTMAVMLGMFAQLICKVAAGQPLPISEARWKRKAYTRRELEALCSVTPDMPVEEIRRRVRATDFPGYRGAEMTVGGFCFAYKNLSDRPV